MKYIALLIALSAASLGAVQTWTKTTNIEFSATYDEDKEFILGASPYETRTFEFNGGSVCAGSINTSPPWTTYFSTTWIKS